MLNAQMEHLILTSTWMDERKVDWCTFARADGKEVTIGFTSEEFVSLKRQYSLDLQFICRLAIEQLEQWPTSSQPIQIEGKTFHRLMKVLKEWDYRLENVKESGAGIDVDDAIDCLSDELNRRHGEGWEYWFTERYAPETIRGSIAGSRYVFRRKKYTLSR